MPAWPESGHANDDDVDPDEFDFEADMLRQDEEDLSPEGIERQNRYLLEEQRRFRRAADIIVETWRAFPEVQTITLIGSVAVPLWKEVPRFQPYRRANIELWHECRDLDLAVQVNALDNLGGLRKAKDRALAQAREADDMFGVASHQVDTFLFEPGSNRHLGRLCSFNRCPKGHRDCTAPGCGDQPFLKQVPGFRVRKDMFAPGKTMLLFDRASGVVNRAFTT